MQHKLTTDGTKWYDKEGKSIANKLFKTLRFIKQIKSKGKIVFVYEDKSKSSKIEKSVVDSQDEQNPDFSEEESFGVDVDEKAIRNRPLIVKNRKINFIDDKNIGQGDKGVILSRVRKKTVKPPSKPVIIRCSVCSKDIKIPAWEADRGESIYYRCNKCCGG